MPCPGHSVPPLRRFPVVGTRFIGDNEARGSREGEEIEIVADDYVLARSLARSEDEEEEEKRGYKSASLVVFAGSLARSLACPLSVSLAFQGVVGKLNERSLRNGFACSFALPSLP